MKKLKAILIFAFLLLSFNLHAEKGQKELFSILGCISREYISRFNPYTKIDVTFIESFYPGEVEIAERFELLLREYYKIYNRQFSVKKVIGPQGHIYFYDKWMAKRINKHYSKVEGCHENCAYTINKQYILSANNNEMLEYILSAYIRNSHQKTKSLHFTNAPYLAQTIAAAIEKMGGRDVTLYHCIKYGVIPSSYVVVFSSFPELEKITGLLGAPPVFNDDWEKMQFTK